MKVHTSEDLFCGMYLASLISIDEVGHGCYLWIALVPVLLHAVNLLLLPIKDSHSRFSLLTIEGINLTSRKHVREHKVLQDLDALRRSRLIVVAKRFKEVFAGFVPLA